MSKHIHNYQTFLRKKSDIKSLYLWQLNVNINVKRESLFYLIQWQDICANIAYSNYFSGLMVGSVDGWIFQNHIQYKPWNLSISSLQALLCFWLWRGHSPISIVCPGTKWVRKTSYAIQMYSIHTGQTYFIRALSQSNEWISLLLVGHPKGWPTIYLVSFVCLAVCLLHTFPKPSLICTVTAHMYASAVHMYTIAGHMYTGRIANYL